MKTHLLAAIISLVLINSTIGGQQYIGRWRPLSNQVISSDLILTIKKAGDYYVMLSSKQPNDPVALTYDSKTASLSGKLDGMHFWMQISRSGWLGMHPDQGDVVLFERLKK